MTPRLPPDDAPDRSVSEVEARHAALIASAGLAIVSFELDGTITGWNDGATRLFGWTAGEAVGRDPEELIETAEPFATTLAQRTAELASGKLLHPYIETTRRHKDGREIQVGVSLSFIVGPDGQAIGASAIYQDLTERDQAVSALARSERQFRLIGDNAQDIIYRVQIGDGKPTLEYLSPSAEAILGYPRERLQRERRLLFDRTHEDDRERTLGSFLSLDEVAGTFRVRWQRSDGRWIMLEDRRTMLGQDGSAVSIIGIARDITAEHQAAEETLAALATERQVAEQLRDLDEMKTAFLSAVSHELRTPLTSVLGFAETAKRQLAAGEMNVAGYLDRVVVNAQRLEQLMDDLLDVDRLSRSVIAPRLREVDLAVAVQRSARPADLPDHRIEFDVEPVIVPIDSVMIDRVVDNLVRNAGRHTPAGTTVWVRVRAVDDGARIIVEDDGPGVPAGERERVFDPFQQGRDASAAPSPGTGIGLSLVRRFVEVHGGHVHLDERPGGGARFVVDLPSHGLGATPAG